MKFASFTVILLSAIVVASSALGGGAEGRAAVAEGNDADKSSSTNSQLQQQHQQRRDLLSSWCPSSTPVLWHRDLTKTWSAGTCINVADCDSPGFQTQLECCKGAFGGQMSGACLKGLPNPPTQLPTSLLTKSPSHLPTSLPTKSPTALNTNEGKWYADYGTTWTDAGCKTTLPHPNYATLFFDTQLECCKSSFAGQTSNACLKGLPDPPTQLPTSLLTKSPSHLPTSLPTKSPTALNTNEGKWYADYGTTWTDAGCKTTLPHPNYATLFFDTQLECCKSSFAGQTSNACLKGLPDPPTQLPTSLSTKSPSHLPTSTPTKSPTAINPNEGKWYADYGTVWINAGCKNTLPHPNYATHYFESQEECCNSAYAGQTSGACLIGLRSKSPIMPTTNIPSASPVTSKPTSSEPTSSPSTNTPTAFPVTSKPTSSKPTLEPISPTSIPTTGKPSQIPTSKPTSSEPSKSPTTSNPTLIPSVEAPYTKPPATDFPTTATDFPTGEVAQITDAAMVVDDDDILVKDVV